MSFYSLFFIFNQYDDYVQVFNEPKWKLELVVQYLWKYIAKVSQFPEFWEELYSLINLNKYYPRSFSVMAVVLRYVLVIYCSIATVKSHFCLTGNNILYLVLFAAFCSHS